MRKQLFDALGRRDFNSLRRRHGNNSNGLLRIIRKSVCDGWMRDCRCGGAVHVGHSTLCRYAWNGVRDVSLGYGDVCRTGRGDAACRGRVLLGTARCAPTWCGVRDALWRWAFGQSAITTFSDRSCALASARSCAASSALAGASPCTKRTSRGATGMSRTKASSPA